MKLTNLLAMAEAIYPSSSSMILPNIHKNTQTEEDKNRQIFRAELKRAIKYLKRNITPQTIRNVIEAADDFGDEGYKMVLRNIGLSVDYLKSEMEKLNK